MEDIASVKIPVVAQATGLETAVKQVTIIYTPQCELASHVLTGDRTCLVDSLYLHSSIQPPLMCLIFRC